MGPICTGYNYINRGQKLGRKGELVGLYRSADEGKHRDRVAACHETSWEVLLDSSLPVDQGSI